MLHQYKGENYQNEGLTQRQLRLIGNKSKQKLIRRSGKYAKRLLLKAAKTFSTTLLKVLSAIVGFIGIPTLLYMGAMIVLTILLSSILTSLFSFGDGLEGEDKELQTYVKNAASATVDLNNPIESPYRVPETLIHAILQIQGYDDENFNKLLNTVDNIANALAPEFTYGSYNEWTEKQVEIYEDGVLVDPGVVERTDNYVDKIERVDYWSGITEFKYNAHISPWTYTDEVSYREETYLDFIEVEKKVYKNGEWKIEKDIEIVEKTRTIEVITRTWTRYQYFTSTSGHTQDYSHLDSAVNGLGLGLEDKKLIEINYAMAGGTINYTNWLAGKGYGGGFYGGGGSYNGIVIPPGSVPTTFMEFYLAAEAAYGIPWYVLASIHFHETGFSTHPTMISVAGAIGPMQFLSATWVGWKYNIGKGYVSPSLDITDCSIVASGGGYGRDGDGDGKCDPWNEADAIMAAAALLAANGFNSDPQKAVFSYNHSTKYVNSVLSKAEEFKNGAIYQPPSGSDEIPPLQAGSFMRPALGNISSGYGPRGGKMHHGIDIAKSGDVQVVASADGVVSKSYFSDTYGNVVFILHNINGVQYETVYAHLRNRVVQEGDVVKQGQFLGYMGNTGRSSGQHLHFEVHVGRWNINKSNSINPIEVVPF